MENFFNNADQLFKRNIENEKAAKQNEKDKIQEQYNLFKDQIIPEIKDYLDKKQNIIKNIIIKSKEKCLEIINDEIDNASQRLKDADNDLEKASNALEEKIKTEYNEMIKLQENEVKNILDDIIRKSNQAIETHYSKSSLSESEIGIMKGKAIGIVTTLLTGALGGIATGVGLAALGSSVLAGIAAGTISATAMTTLVGSFFGPLGIVAGVGVGGLITGIGFLIRKLTKKSKYIKALEATKTNIEQKFDDTESNFIKNFASFKNTLVNELVVKNDVFLKGIDNIPIPDWNKMIEEYEKRKKDIKNKLNEEINNF
jgi:vacuolar-type H+-ATPase subunit H